MIVEIVAILLICTGLWGLMSQKNMIKLVISFNIFDNGLNLLIVRIGYIAGKAAPILDRSIFRADPSGTLIDPLPSALVLTSIVIGVVITAVMLVFCVLYYRKTGSMELPDSR